jgi:hypothetical protein
MRDIRMIDVKSRVELSESISTLKETSKDDHDDNNVEYMTTSELSAVNFDLVKKKYKEILFLPEAPKSCDALYYNESEEDYLIEFKNGKVDKRDVEQKIFESLLVLTDIVNQNISYTRENLSFILVYNKTKNPKMFILSNISNKANKKPNALTLERFRRLYFKDVYTVSKEEFETRFVKNWSK